MIRFDCPECGESLKVKDEFAGRNGKCYLCRAAIKVPSSVPAQLPALPSIAAVRTDIGRPRPPLEVRQVEPPVPVRPIEPSSGPFNSLIKPFITDEQNPEVVARVHEQVSSILMRGETLEYIAIQNKPLVNLAPDCIVLTNKRFIVYRRTVTGRASFNDYVWRELCDARIDEGILGATITIICANGQWLQIDYLPKPQARQVYRIAQEQEEKALEERRQRDLETRRATAGGVVVQTAYAPPPQPAPQATSNVDDPVAVLQKLKTMLDAGLISADDYEKKKAEVMARM